jgi:hypothetical protein
MNKFYFFVAAANVGFAFKIKKSDRSISIAFKKFQLEH